jgi:hypothetical protein
MAEKKTMQKSGPLKGIAANSPAKKTANLPPPNVSKVKKTVAKKPEEPPGFSMNDFALPDGESMEDEVSATVVYHFAQFLEKYKVSRNTAKMWCRERWLGHSPVGGLTYIRQIDFFRMLRHFFKPPFYDLILLLPFLCSLGVRSFL